MREREGKKKGTGIKLSFKKEAGFSSLIIVYQGTK